MLDLFKWFRKKPVEKEAPSDSGLEIEEVSLDEKERADLFKLLHCLDSLNSKRTAAPINDAREVSRIMQHFASKNVFLPWDVNGLKAVIRKYEKSIGNPV